MAECKIHYFSVLATLAGPSYSTNEHEQIRLSVPRDQHGSGQDQCHLQRSCWHHRGEGGLNAPPILRHRTCSFGCILPRQHAHGHACDTAACGIIPWA